MFLSWNCSSFSTGAVTQHNFAAKYENEEKELNPKYVLYNLTDSVTRLYFSLDASELLYVNNTERAEFTANIQMSYCVHPLNFPKLVTDSGCVILSDKKINGKSKILMSSTDMDILKPGNYFIEVTFRDLNKINSSYDLLYLNHESHNSCNNFLLKLDSTENPLFRNYIYKNEKIRIEYYTKQHSKLFVKYYKSTNKLAPPPYSLEKQNDPVAPDSCWWINYTPKESIALEKEGCYTFNTDSFSNKGLTVAKFQEGFPKITIPKQLLYPLRYLTMRDEYKSMDTAVNTKKAVDDFWINNAGSQEHAREVIRIFYNRVASANSLFSTQIEGWKTDRGLIYLVFGPPENVFRTANYETWIYGSTVGNNPVTFIFNHKSDSFTDQEFVLERNTEYKLNWITAVDFWRQGNAYNLK